MLSRKKARKIILFLIIIFLFLFSFTGCFSNKQNEEQKPLSDLRLLQITPFPTVEPNPTNKLKEILSLNWGNNEEEVGCYGEINYSLIVDHTNSYGPYDFFVDKEEYIYIADSYNHRVLKFKDKKICKTYSYVKEIPYLCYPSFYTDNKGNLYVVEIFGGEIRNNKVLKLDNDNIFLYVGSDLSEQFTNYEIRIDEQSGICKEMQFKDDKMEITFPLKPVKKHDFEFLGIDEAYNFYFYKRLIKHYNVSEKDNIKGVILYGPFEGYMVNQGIILYKYSFNGEFIKQIIIDDPIPYDVKVSLKGDIYFSARLRGQQLLTVPLDRYRIYKFTI